MDRLSRMWDRARDMYTRAGLRPYVITIVRVRSAGARRRGDGVPVLVGEWRLLPTPKIGDLSGLQEVLNPDQLREMGQVLLSEISLSYTEDILLGRGDDGTPVPPDETVYYEIQFLDGTGMPRQRRRFTAASPPFANVAQAMWTISLTRAHGDRDRQGVPR